MTEVDATKRPLEMPVRFIPYLDKYRVYLLFKQMIEDLLVNLPRDHLKQIKIFLAHNLHTSRDVDKVMLLVSPELNIDTTRLVKDLIKDLGVFVITRRCVMDRYEKHDDFQPGCISTSLMAEVTKNMTLKDPVITGGWLMFDHPCTVREARYLQQDGVLPTVTLVLTPPPAAAEPAQDARTPIRSFFQQDFEGLKYAYKATLKEVLVEEGEDLEHLAGRCYSAVQACAAGAQGPGQAFSAVGAPSIYRVVVIGPRGSGRKTQARTLAMHFGLIYLNYDVLYNEARERRDDIGEKLRNYGPSVQLKADIIQRRILQKDCIDHGWVLTGYPLSALEFDNLESMPTPPNRIIILNVDWKLCKQRAMAVAVDWCTGKRTTDLSGPRVVMHPGDDAMEIENELEFYFSESLAELRAAAGITATEIYCGNDGPDEIQTRLQAAVIKTPAYNIESGGPLRADHVRGD